MTLPGGPLVVAGVSGSPGSVHALRYAADLARRHGTALIPVLACVPGGSIRPGQSRKEHVRAGLGYHAPSLPPV